MDPNLFHLDWERTFEVLAAIVILSMLVERTLASVFENSRLIDLFDGNGAKEIVAFLVALGICLKWNFDAVSMIILTEQTSIAGEIITAGVIAGGSKGSIKLFRDVMQFHSNAWVDRQIEKGRMSPEEAGRPANNESREPE